MQAMHWHLVWRGIYRKHPENSGISNFLTDMDGCRFSRTDQWSGPSGRFDCGYCNVIPRLFEPQIVDATGMFWLALLGIAFNGFAFWLN